MSSKNINASQGTAYTNLPVKISGIVFWGLVVVGLVASSAFISFFESRLNLERDLKIGLAQDEMIHIFSTLEHKPASSSIKNLESLQERFGFIGMEVSYGEESLSTGTLQADSDVFEWGFQTQPSDSGSRDQQQVWVKLYLPRLQEQVSGFRKNILMLMAAIFLGFGFLLQAILKRVLSRPITRMVETADGIVKGDNSLRFDEDRNDEFGFLGTFINRVLDHLTKKQQELESSLTGRTIAEQFLSREKERAEITLYSISDAVITTTRTGHIDFMNRAAEELTGLQASGLHGEDLSTALNLYFVEEDKPLVLPVNAAVEPNTDIQHVPLNGTCVLKRRDDKQLNIKYNIAPILDRNGTVMGSVIVLHDITDSLTMTEKLSFQATHDSLTGLMNRAEFDHRIHVLLEQSHDSSSDVTHALLYMDLDQFKIVNDSCGHMAGDELLRQISERLSQRLAGKGILARLGGDEFGVLIKNCSKKTAYKTADGLRKEVENFRFLWEDKTFTLGISMGVVMINNDSESPDILLSMADRACYAAKDSGRNRIRIYQPNDIEMVRRNRDTQWVSRLRKSLETDSLLLSRQFIVPVENQTDTGEMYEILIGMMNEKGDRIPAGAFLPAAERYSLMPQMDRWIVKNVFDWLSRNPGYVARLDSCMINLSGLTLNDDSFAAHVYDCIENSSVAPEKICFEITETAAISNLAKTGRLIRNLKAEGCRFALDDFGSGMSSYAYLKHLPVDFVKIDGIFVRDLADDPIDRALVTSINEIAHILDKKTIAEYVENDKILEILREIGVDFAQGFGIAHPEAITEQDPPDDSQASKGT
jgi:diguanylate cyclase (GGDEF)-like protein/PAS domain S-box-containing protein